MVSKAQHQSLTMPGILAAILLFVGAALLLGCNQKPAARLLSWGLLDKTTNVNTNLANGASFTFSPADQFIVTLQVQDPDGIKEMDVSGSGTFQCSYIDGKGTIYNCASVKSDFIPKQTTTIGSSGSYQGFVMSLPFRYYDIPCGKTYDNKNSCQVYSGTLHVQGNETSWPGAATSATLDLNP